MPIRVQRQRTKGWKMPPGVVYVGRPTKWGNPFGHLQRFSSLEDSLIAYRMACEGIWDPSKLKNVGDGPFRIAHGDWQEFQKRFKGYGPTFSIQAELRGKDLACWCKIGAPCHADILIEIANV